MTKTLVLSVLALTALFAFRGGAQESHDGGGNGKAAAHAAAPVGHGAVGAAHGEADHEAAGPVVPTDRHAAWPGVVLIIIAFLFAAAIPVGVIARMHAPPAEVMPPTHSHDEPPGASHHHGASGTINPEPGHGAGHGHH